MSGLSTSARRDTTSTATWWARAATAFVAALALVLGVTPAASAQSGSTRIGDFTFNASINHGGSDLRPGGHVRLDLTATNTHGTGRWLASNRVLNTYGFTVPAGYTLRGSGGDHMENVGNHGQGGSYWGGKTSGFGMSSVQRDSSRSGWLSFNIPANAQGGTTYRFGVRAELETGNNWFPTASNVVSFTLPRVGTSTNLSVSPTTARVGEETTLTATVSSAAGSSNTPTGNVNFSVGGQNLSARVINGVATVTTTFDTAGNFPVTASFSPTTTARWHTSTASGTVNVQTEATQTDLSLDPVEVLAGGMIQASASVNPAGAEGEIEFTLGDTTTSVPVGTDGTAAAELPAGATTGEQTVTATFIPANPERYTESSDSQTVDVFEQTSTSTEVTVEAGPVRAGHETTLTATVSPETAAGEVTFTIGDQTFPATVIDGTATLEHTFATAGEHVVVADFAPTNTERYTASTGQVAVTVEAEATQTALTLDPVEVTAGGEVTATAQITPPEAAGEVRFDYGDESQTIPVADGEATAAFTAQAAETGTITATFLPTDTGRYTSSTDTQTVDINAEATQTALDLDPVSVIEGDTIQASANVTPAGAEGEIEFTAGETTIRVPVDADGTAATELQASAPGEMIVTATFIPADPVRYAGSSDSRSVDVSEQIATSTSLTADDPARAGEETTLTANVSPAEVAGTVTFTIDGESVPVTVSDGTATLDHTFATAGEHVVVAEFAPEDSVRYAASSGEVTVNVEAEATQTALTLDPVEVTAGGELTATAQITPADAAGEVLFEYGDQTHTVAVVDGTATATFNAQTAGTDTVTATFIPADTDRYTESTDSQTVNVTAEATQTTITVDTDPVRAGEETTLTATVNPADAAGTVTFTVGDETQAVEVTNGTASTTHTFDAAGEHTVVAEFTPADTGRYTGSSGEVTVSVEAEATQTALTLEPVEVTTGGELTATAQITPADAAGDVEFEYGDQTETVTVVDGAATATFTAQTAGTDTITATFIPTDSERYTESSDSQTVDVTAESTQTTITVDTDPVRAGEDTTLTATVTPADAAGTVTFTVGDQTQTVDVDNGTASTTHTFDAAGEHTVVAEFTPADTGRYTGSTDETTVNVEVEATQTALTLDPVEVTAGGDLTATAQITPAEAAGEVLFEYGDQTHSVAVVDGAATATFTAQTAGTDTVTATFIPADADRYTGSSDSQSVTVEAEATQTALTLDPLEVTAGGTVQASATVTPAGAEGSIEFTAGEHTVQVPVDANGIATTELPVGTAGEVTVTATFIPDNTERYTGSSDSQTVNVTAEATQTALTLEPVEVTAGGELTATAQITPADAAGAVVFEYGDQTETVTVVEGTATATFTAQTAGTDTVTATFIPADTDRYTGSSDSQTVDVTAEATQTTVTVEPLTIEPGEDATLVVDVRPADADGQVRFTIDDDTVTAPVVDGTATLTQLPGTPGEYTVLVEFVPADPDAYAPSSATTTITVTDDDSEPQEPPHTGTGSLSSVGLVVVIGSMLAGAGSLGSLGSVGS